MTLQWLMLNPSVESIHRSTIQLLIVAKYNNLLCVQHSDKAFINGLHQGGMDPKDIAVKAKVGLSTVYTIIKAGYT